MVCKERRMYMLNVNWHRYVNSYKKLSILLNKPFMLSLFKPPNWANFNVSSGEDPHNLTVPVNNIYRKLFKKTCSQNTQLYPLLASEKQFWFWCFRALAANHQPTITPQICFLCAVCQFKTVYSKENCVGCMCHLWLDWFCLNNYLKYLSKLIWGNLKCQLGGVSLE